MALENLAFRTARRHIANYVTESAVMAEHQQAMECRDCESFLQLAIDAFHWVIRADQEIRQGMADGSMQSNSDELTDTLDEFCRSWIKHGPFADAWIRRQNENGYVPDNLPEFEECRREMESIVKSFAVSDDAKLPGFLVPLRNQALDEFSNGQTSEFV